MFIPKEEHHRNRIVQFIHLIKVRNLVDVAEVDDGEVFDLVGDAYGELVLVHS